MSKRLERACSAESVGISSKVIQKMIDEMMGSKVDIHSIMVLRHGKVACEAWKSPITADDVHMVYSISKSFLSVAYGFAITEGLLTEDVRFLDVFPEYEKNADNNLRKLTLMHLIGMRSGKRTSRTGDDWLKSFVNAKWDFEPDTDWRYVNDNYYAASAALVKIIGMSVTEYLTPRLFEPLGIEVPFWEKCPKGIEAGGWGLQLKTEDIAKFILCCHNNGVFDGKQVIPAQWIEKATSKISENYSSQKEADSKAGYGYGFWQCAGMPNTFRCEGMYSQYAISFKDYDACLVITSGCANLQLTLDILWKHIKDAFIEPTDSVGVEIEILPSLPFEKSMRSELEKDINKKVYKLRKQLFIDACGYPAGSLPMPVTFFANEKGGDISDLSFEFDSKGFVMKWSEAGKFINTHYISLDGTFSKGKITVGEMSFDTVGYGRWINANELEVCIRALAAVAERRFVFTFSGNKIAMYPDMIPSMDERAKIIGEKLKTILKGRYFEWWIDVLVPRVKYILQPTHHGKIK